MARKTVLDHILRSTSLQLEGYEAQEQALLERLAPSTQLALPQGPALQSVLSWAAGLPLPDDAGVPLPPIPPDTQLQRPHACIRACAGQLRRQPCLPRPAELAGGLSGSYSNLAVHSP